MRNALVALLAPFCLQAAISWTFESSMGQPVAREVASVCVADASGFSSSDGSSGTVTVNRIWKDGNGFTWLGGRELGVLAGGIYPVWPWVAKLDPNGCLLFTVRIQTMGQAEVQALAADRAGRVWVAGSLYNNGDFPVRIPFTGSFTSEVSGMGFLFRLSADGSQLLWSNYLHDDVSAMALDASENVYLTGVATTFEYSDTLKLSTVALRNDGPGGYVQGAYILKVSSLADRVLLEGIWPGTGICAAAAAAAILPPVPPVGLRLRSTTRTTYC